MIPKALRDKIEQHRSGDIDRTYPDAVNEALEALGIPLDSKFGDFFREYAVTSLATPGDKAELRDLLEPTTQIMHVTQFVHEVWELPENYICLSSVQSEGAYLYDRDRGAVWDFDLADREDFIAGRQKPAWNSFFEFMNWYLSEE